MKGYKIHIIDDDPATHEVLRDYLHLAGFKVGSAFNGRAGLELMHSDPPDLVLLDIQMPELDGFGLLKAVGEDPALSQVPILIITSLQRTNLKIKGLELGADDFIVKPFECAELFARIKAALRRSGRYGRTAGLLSGALVDVGLAELLQTLDIGKKTALIRLPEMDGEIHADNGTLRYIRQGEHTGAAAMDRLLLLHRGMFTVHFGALPDAGQQQPPVGIQQQILTSLVCLDTIREILAILPEPNPEIGNLQDLPDFSGKEQLEKQLPLALCDLLAALPGNLEANAERLVQGYRTGQN